MIKLFTLLILLLPIISTAQDYQCILPGQKQYFTNRFGYLKGIHTDSVKTSGSTTTIYPYHSPRGDYEPHVFNNFPIKGGSWLGKTITVHADGVHSFENYWGGTLEIKTQAILNESWNLYTDATDTFYTATITAIDTMSFMNVMDSVKLITIQAYNSSGALTTDPLHNTEILLSKQHGFVKVCDLYMFPLHEPAKAYKKGFDYLHDISSRENTDIFFTQINYSNPTLHEIYDFNVGDRFLNVYYGPTEKKQLKIIADKQVIGVSEIRYKISTWEEKRKASSIDKETTGYLADFVVFNTPLLSTIHMPEEWGVQRYFRISPGRKNCVDTTYSEHSYLECGIHYHYQKGLGLVTFDECLDPTPSNQQNITLLSWQKGSEFCGQYPTLGIATSNIDNNITTYPNPAIDYVDITCAAANNHMMLLAMDGKVVAENKFSGNAYRLDLSTVSTGVYIIAVQNGSTITHSKLMVQH